ncbi:hypothetical protein GQ44DRAFT_324893 [Phaeosphaeriaceae sp. PMI808]|nr:hypothetical protein GQ44DRAFT_324893 [Phaeosphaeriaceae sp. PMI808]
MFTLPCVLQTRYRRLFVKLPSDRDFLSWTTREIKALSLTHPSSHSHLQASSPRHSLRTGGAMNKQKNSASNDLKEMFDNPLASITNTLVEASRRRNLELRKRMAPKLEGASDMPLIVPFTSNTKSNSSIEHILPTKEHQTGASFRSLNSFALTHKLIPLFYHRGALF